MVAAYGGVASEKPSAVGSTPNKSRTVFLYSVTRSACIGTTPCADGGTAPPTPAAPAEPAVAPALPPALTGGCCASAPGWFLPSNPQPPTSPASATPSAEK